MKAIMNIISEKRGNTTLQMLIAILIIGGITLAATNSIKKQLVTTHDSAVTSITSLTGSGN